MPTAFGRRLKSYSVGSLFLTDFATRSASYRIISRIDVRTSISISVEPVRLKNVSTNHSFCSSVSLAQIGGRMLAFASTIFSTSSRTPSLIVPLSARLNAKQLPHRMLGFQHVVATQHLRCSLVALR